MAVALLMSVSLLVHNLGLIEVLRQQKRFQIHHRHWVLLLCLFVISPL